MEDTRKEQVTHYLDQLDESKVAEPDKSLRRVFKELAKAIWTISN